MRNRSLVWVRLLALSLLVGVEVSASVTEVEIVGDIECRVKTRLDVQLCGVVNGEIFIVYNHLNTDTWKDEIRVAMGWERKVSGVDESDIYAVTSTSTLQAVEVLEVVGNWRSHDLVITVARKRGKEKTFFFTPSGMPSLWGEFLELEEAPTSLAQALPPEAQTGFYGKIPSIRESFLIYSLPLQEPEEGPEDGIGRLMSTLYPSLAAQFRVQMGHDEVLKEVEVQDGYSYGGGAHIYLDTERGTFLISGHGQHLPFLGETMSLYYVPDPREWSDQ